MSLISKKFKLIETIVSVSLFFLYVLNTHSQSSTKEIIHESKQIRVKNDLLKITKTQHSRNYQNIKTLDSIANYIKSEFVKVCDSTAFQPYKLKNNIYKNVIGSIGLQHKERIIVGAHYDVCGNQQGADDNASGVAGVLELARLLSKENLKYRIDFVAYTLEEPPFFGTEYMGSYEHAKYLHTNTIPVKGMVCLEMIGYYDDAKGSQQYPIPEMKLLYGDSANFIVVVRNKKSKTFGAEISKLMQEQKLIKTVDFEGTGLTTGINFSDHRNYLYFGFPAVMITDTAFYRNKNYHTKNDTVETLDIDKMCAVIQQLYLSIRELK